ncbi:MAG: glycosyltransferase family 2 protein [Bacteroidaceae bacterium]|nr:glycosyltransferase family 2 protein [Bacteroidaceae bacterium]
MNWYEPYLSVYGKPFDAEAMHDTVQAVHDGLSVLQSDAPLVTVSVIAYNEEQHLLACLWSLSQMQTSFPVEVIGVDNDSTDRTAAVFEACGVPYYTETRHSCGFARQCGLDHARGRFHLNIDSDTLYPPAYVELMTRELLREGTVAVSSLWSYIPDRNHSRLGLWFYELLRDSHLWFQHFSRPELSVRGLVFGYSVEAARRFGIRTDIIRGEDGYLAFQLRDLGKIRFLRNRRARAVTGYGTVSESLGAALWLRIRKYTATLGSYFTSKDKYEDKPDNLVNP